MALRVFGCASICLATFVLAFGTQPAQADGVVSALPGRVTFEGDDAEHTLRVDVSPIDVSFHEWALTGAIWGGAGVEAARGVAAEWSRWEPLVENAILEGMQPLPALDNVPADVQALASQYEAARVVADQKAAEFRQLLSGAMDLMEDPLSSTGDVFERIQLTKPAEEGMKIAGDLQAAAAEQLLAIVDRSKTWGEALFRRVNISLERFGWAARGMSRFFKVALWVAPALSAAQMLSNHSVVFRDSPGNELTAIFPCRHVVRGHGGTTYPNAVSCPAPEAIVTLDPSNLFGLLGYTELAIATGGAADKIAVRVDDQEESPFDDITITAGGGSDRIVGSDVGEQIFAGPGDDKVFGRGGDDYIYGQYGSLEYTGAESDNDTLWGERGRDVINGELGHDKIFGGPGDDSGLLGTALTGGLGNDVIVGGPGDDDMQGGEGRDTILAKESDFSINYKDPGGARQLDEKDGLIDCGPWEGSLDQYVTFGTAEGSNVYNCIQPSITSLTIEEVKNAKLDANGLWPWLD